MECWIALGALVVLAVPVMALIALVRSGSGSRALAEVEALRKDLNLAKEQVKVLTRRLELLQKAGGVAEARTSEATAVPPSVPEPRPEPAAPPAPPALPAVVTTSPSPRLEDTQELPVAVPPPPPLPSSLPEPPVAVVLPRAVVADPPPPVPVPAAARPQPAPPRPLPPPPAPAPRRSLEDLLGTQVFLKAGVAILVLGVVFAMGLVFQMVGPAGKVLLGLLSGGAILAGGRHLEGRPGFEVFGRTLVGGAWGILYFVAYAAGFVHAARVLPSPGAGVAAMLLMGGAAVGYSLRYRHEWTTLAAFLLIHLSLGCAAVELGSGGNLAATLVAAASLGLIAWRTGWVRLLSLGTLATWAVVALWMMGRPPQADPALLVGLCFLALLLQAVMVGMEVESEEWGWLGVAQIGNFLGVFGYVLREASPGGMAWAWAAGIGLTHLGAAFCYGRSRRHPLFLLTATEALAALAFVTPLRLGLHHHLTPLMRLMGLELLLAWGVFLKERYFRILAALGFAATVADLLLFRLGLPAGERSLLLGAGAALLLLNATLVRTRWREACATELPGMPWAYSAAGTLLLAILVGLEAPPAATGALYGVLALAWVILSLHRVLPDLAVEGGVLGILAFGASLTLLAREPEARHMLVGVLGASAMLLVSHVAARLRAVGERSLPEDGISLLRGLFSATGWALLVILAFRKLPQPWPVPAVALLGLALVAAALTLGWREWLVEGLLLSGVAVAGLLPGLAQAGSRVAHLSHRAWQLLLLPLLFLLKGALLARREAAWPFADEARERLEGVFGATAPLLLAILCFLELPALLVAPGLMLLALLWLRWAGWTQDSERQALRVWVGFALALVGFVAVGTHAWSLAGRLGPLPARLASTGLALLLTYLAQQRFERGPEREGTFHACLESGVVRGMGATLLVLAALVLGALVKAEALVHGKNLLVAVAWGLAGLLHLERGRFLRGGAWRSLGHLWMGAAMLHFLTVNLLQPGSLGFLSLRLATGPPLLGMLTFVYLAWEPEDQDPEALRWVYFAALQAAVALVVLYELPRAWVLPAWALQGVGSLAWGLRTEALRWARSGMVLALACVVRAIGTNLYMRDELAGLRLNLVAVPLAVALLLAGYLLLNRAWRQTGEAGSPGEGTHRLPWFIAQAVVLFAFIWVEVSGTELTVWLSAFGLGMVGLGFLVQERLGRQTGLGILCACILKLFLYDLRGLSGLPRVLSFIVLGAVLIAVSYAYTRFKERLL